jgi:hypothetical protein
VLGAEGLGVVVAPNVLGLVGLLRFRRQTRVPQPAVADGVDVFEDLLSLPARGHEASLGLEGVTENLITRNNGSAVVFVGVEVTVGELALTNTVDNAELFISKHDLLVVESIVDGATVRGDVDKVRGKL